MSEVAPVNAEIQKEYQALLDGDIQNALIKWGVELRAPLTSTGRSLDDFDNFTVATFIAPLGFLTQTVNGRKLTPREAVDYLVQWEKNWIQNETAGLVAAHEGTPTYVKNNPCEKLEYDNALATWAWQKQYENRNIAQVLLDEWIKHEPLLARYINEQRAIVTSEPPVPEKPLTEVQGRGERLITQPYTYAWAKPLLAQLGDASGSVLAR